MGIVNLVAKIKVEGIEVATRGLSTLRASFQNTADTIKSLAEPLRNVSLLLGAGSIGIGYLAFQAASKMDSLTRGLATVSKNAEDLQGQLKRLQEVAKLPGLSFEQAVSGSLALQSSGLSARDAERALRGFGNALASVGKGSASLERVNTALKQILDKGKFSAEEIQQLAEAGIPTGKILQDAFGTADTEKIQKLGITAEEAVKRMISAVEKLPSVSGGIGNLVENLADRFQRLLVPLGKGIAQAFESASPSVERFLDNLENRFTQIGEVIAAIGKSGVLEDVLGKLSAAFNNLFGPDFQDGFARFAATALSVIGNLPTAIKQVADYLLTIVNNLGIAFENTAKFVKFLTSPDLFKLPTFTAFQQLPPLDKAGIGGLTKDASSYYDLLRKAGGPLSELPSGVTFGGNGFVTQGASQSATSGDTTIDLLLRAIEENTKKTADALSLRAQSLGGGELAKLGVTATELGRAQGQTYAPQVPANSQIERAIRELLRQEMGRGGGGGPTRVRVGG